MEEKHILAFSQMKFTWQLVHHQSSLYVSHSLWFSGRPMQSGRGKRWFMPQIFVAVECVLENEMLFSVAPNQILV